jgi:hypothetical protein
LSNWCRSCTISGACGRLLLLLLLLLCTGCCFAHSRAAAAQASCAASRASRSAWMLLWLSSTCKMQTQHRHALARLLQHAAGHSSVAQTVCDTQAACCWPQPRSVCRIHPLALEHSTARHGVRCSPAVLLPAGLVPPAQPKPQTCCGWLLLPPLLRHCRCMKQQQLPWRAG